MKTIRSFRKKSCPAHLSRDLVNRRPTLMITKKMATFISIKDAPLELENFGLVNILDYCELLNDRHECENNYVFEMKKGSQLFQARFVTNLRFASRENGVSVRSTVKAEMKKRMEYDVIVEIDSNNKVTDAECECPGGRRPACCKHVFGVLSAVEDYSRLELFRSPTEKLQQWHQPKPKLVPAMPVPDPPPSNGECDSTVNYHALKDLPQTTPIFSILSGASQTSLAVDEIFYESTPPLPLPKKSNGFSDLPQNMPLHQILFYQEQIQLNLQAIQALERETICQDSDTWHRHRAIRITASNVGKILHSTNYEKLALDLSKPGPDLSSVKPVQFGRLNEPSVKNLLRHKFQHHVFRNTGLVVSESHPFIAASPDGLLFHADCPMLVEIKCIFNMDAKMDLLHLSRQRKDFCLVYNDVSKQFSLSREHRYYDQIQCQLFCANMQSCLFVLLFHQSKPLFMETIYFDEKVWEQKLQKLAHFYFQYYIEKLSQSSSSNMC